MPEPGDTHPGELLTASGSSLRQRRVVRQQSCKGLRSEGDFDIRYGGAEFGVCPMVFSLALVRSFLTVLPSLCFVTGM